MSKLKTIIVVGVCLIGTAGVWAQPALADAAPEPPPDGKNIDPGEETTMVQMVAEEVIIDVGATREEHNMGEDYAFMTLSGYLVAYNCTFWMVNQGDTTEQMTVRFPIRSQFEVGTVDIHSMRVDGKPVDWHEDEIDWHADFTWAHFDVTFPPGEEVEIKVTYTTLTREDGKGQPEEIVTYVLETGAGWYGPIGQGRIILRLPYPATPENVHTDDRSEGAVFNESDVYWEFTDLEPTRQDNLWVEIISPETWFEITAAREKLEDSPNNLSALRRLADAVFSVTVYPWAYDLTGSPELYNEGLAAMAKAVSLAPNDPEVHWRYLEYLMSDPGIETYDTFKEEIEIMEQLDPDYEFHDPGLLDWAMGRFEHLFITPPPTSAEAVTATPESIAAVPTETPKPTKTATATPTEIPKPRQEWTPLPPPPPNKGVFTVGFGIAALAVIGLIVLGYYILKQRN